MKELPRQLGFKDAVGILVGSVIGSAIFKVAKDMSHDVHTPAMVLAVWVVGGLISFAGGLTFAELGTRFPDAGGMYVYLRSAFGRLPAFLYGWSLLLVIQTGSIAAVAAAFSQYFTEIAHTPESWQIPIAELLIVLLTAVNAVSTLLGARLQNLSTLMKCLGIMALIAMVATSGQATTRHFTPLVADGFSFAFLMAIGNALSAALWAYDGWYQVGNIAGELEDPEKEVPRALMVGLAICCLLYIAVTAAYHAVLSPLEVAASDRVAATTARAVMGSAGAWWISIAVAISTFGCVNGMTLSGPRVYYAMARDGLLPAVLGSAHPRFLTPFWPIVIQGVWSVVLVRSGKYDDLYNYVMFVGWVFYILASLALIVERRKNPDVRCYKAWGYPWTTLGFILGSTFLFVSTFYNYPIESLKGCAILAVGVVYYGVATWWTGNRGAS